MSSDNFFPRNVCPIDDLTRQWIDARASWLVYQFGAEQIRSCPIILPTVDFFPDDYRETAADARNMLIRLCDYLEVEAESVDLAFFNTPIPIDDGASASGLDPDDGARIRIWIDHAELHKPLSMATTIIAELCRVRLLGDCEIALSEVEQEAELEHLIDLTAVFSWAWSDRGECIVALRNLADRGNGWVANAAEGPFHTVDVWLRARLILTISRRDRSNLGNSTATGCARRLSKEPHPF